MDMKLDNNLIKRLRQDRSWSQDQLATATGLSFRHQCKRLSFCTHDSPLAAQHVCCL